MKKYKYRKYCQVSSNHNTVYKLQLNKHYVYSRGNLN